jgi:phosphoglycolate phosphatase-like HAD superfamily hydrolase
MYEVPKWARNSAEHKAVYEQIYELAANRLEDLARELEPGTWAVSLDADETVIDNSLYQEEVALVGEKYTPETWDLWVRRLEAPALPGALEFLGLIHDLGGKAIIVTNRDEPYCDLTRENFRHHGIPFDLMLCRIDGKSDKAPRWEAVRTGKASPDLPPLEFVMWLGDNGFSGSRSGAPPRTAAGLRGLWGSIHHLPQPNVRLLGRQPRLEAAGPTTRLRRAVPAGRGGRGNPQALKPSSPQALKSPTSSSCSSDSSNPATMTSGSGTNPASVVTPSWTRSL